MSPTIRELTTSDVTFTVHATPEEMIAPETDLDPEIAAEIRERIDDGDDWAWCDVEVRGTWRNFTASDYLSACSYENEADFIEHSGYYDDMCASVLADLNKQIHETAEHVLDLTVPRRRVLVMQSGHVVCLDCVLDNVDLWHSAPEWTPVRREDSDAECNYCRSRM